MLSMATQESDNPDLRDRGYIYWRLLSTDPNAAKEVVLCERPLISEETDTLEPNLLNELTCHLASLASVYHRPPNSFVESRYLVASQMPSRGNALQAAANKPALPPVPTVIPSQVSWPPLLPWTALVTVTTMLPNQFLFTCMSTLLPNGVDDAINGTASNGPFGCGSLISG